MPKRRHGFYVEAQPGRMHACMQRSSLPERMHAHPPLHPVQEGVDGFCFINAENLVQGEGLALPAALAAWHPFVQMGTPGLQVCRFRLRCPAHLSQLQYSLEGRLQLEGHARQHALPAHAHTRAQAFSPPRPTPFLPRPRGHRAGCAPPGGRHLP